MTTLRLEIVGPKAAALGAAAVKIFDTSGGSIGRVADNDWILPDPYISSRHARIHWRNGQFLIEDTSSNGVFVNSPDRRLGRNQLYALQSGDRLFIDAYEIRATVNIAQPADPFGGADPFRAPNKPPPRQAIPEEFNFGAGVQGAAASDSIDPLQLLGLEQKRSPQAVPRADDLARRSPLSDHYKPPPPAVTPPKEPFSSNAGLRIPEGYDPFGDDGFLQRAPETPPPAPARAIPTPPPPPARAIPTPPPAPVRREPTSADTLDFEAMIRGAGLQGVQVTPELAENFGRILRIVVGGVMDILRAREHIKNEFRIQRTTFKNTDNNPLKFSANVDDALHNLLVKRNSAYMTTEEAFEDAFTDVRNHQMAMLAGVRVAFDAMLGGFEPEQLQETFDRHLKKGSLLSAPARLRYWELYREKFREMTQDPESNFRELFGDEFARAYEEQLDSMKESDRGDRK